MFFYQHLHFPFATCVGIILNTGILFRNAITCHPRSLIRSAMNSNAWKWANWRRENWWGVKSGPAISQEHKQVSGKIINIGQVCLYVHYYPGRHAPAFLSHLCGTSIPHLRSGRMMGVGGGEGVAHLLEVKTLFCFLNCQPSEHQPCLKWAPILSIKTKF